MRRFLITIVFLVIFFAVIGSVQAVEAATLKFDEATFSVASGDTFYVQVIVDAGSEQITSTDIYVLYDATILEAQSVSGGTFFPTVTKNITSGKVYIAGLVDDPATSKTGSGTVATITFKALKNGSATLTFSCDTSTYNTSKIIKNDVNATNIITCAQNGSSAVTVGGGSSSGGGTTAPTPSSLPQTGILDNILKYSIPGMALLLIGWGMRLAL